MPWQLAVSLLDVTVVKAIVSVLCIALLIVASGCSSDPQAAAVADPPAATISDADANAAVPHGDHSPHHGGIVLMNGEIHFEVVLDRDGRHRIFFSDATRADLPASVASQVSLIVTRPGDDPESLTAQIDDSGESWRAEGRPVHSGEATARVSFVASGEPYWIDLPFTPAAP
jgi:hypothetical protein